MCLVSELIAHHCEAFTELSEVLRVPPHVHPFYQLDLYLAGTMQVTVAGLEPFRVRQAEGVLIPPLVRHGFDVSPGLFQSSFKVALAPQYWRFFGTGVRRFVLPPYLVALATEAGDKCRRDRTLQRPLALAVAEVALCELYEQGGAAGTDGGRTENSPHRAELWSLLGQLHAAPDKSWSVPFMARQVGLSNDHFTRVFTSVTGTSPRSYVLALRLRAAAAELLRDDAPPVKTVADHYGYSSVHAFSRAFKRMFGAGPATYRRLQTPF